MEKSAINAYECGENSATVEQGGNGRWKYYQVQCGACGRTTLKYRSPIGAIVAWNRRQGIQAPEKMLDDAAARAEGEGTEANTDEAAAIPDGEDA